MSVEIIFTPIKTPLPPPAGGYSSAGSFRAPWSRVIADLHYELVKAEATDVRLFADLDRHQIRRDGLPYDDARPRSPGVTLAMCKHLRGVNRVELTYPSGTYDTMKGNIRAISLTLGALRSIDRFGVGDVGQQYRAYTALPPGRSMELAEWPNAEAAERFLREVAKTDSDEWREIKRAAMMNTHPDKPGGSGEQFNRVGRAIAIVQGIR